MNLNELTPADRKPGGRYRKYWILYIVLILVGQRLAGIGGSIGGCIIAYGLFKTLTNPFFSRTKKALYSALYIVVGVVSALIIAFVLTFALIKTDVLKTKNSLIDNGVLQISNSNLQNISADSQGLKTVSVLKDVKLAKGEVTEYDLNFPEDHTLYVDLTTTGSLKAAIFAKSEVDKVANDPKYVPRVTYTINGQSSVIPLSSGQYVLLVIGGDQDTTYSFTLRTK